MTDTGKKVTKTSLAVYVGKDKPPLWVRLEAWDRLAECLETAQKGNNVVVTGRLQESTWSGQDGVEKKELVLTLDGFSHASIPTAPPSPEAAWG